MERLHILGKDHWVDPAVYALVNGLRIENERLTVQLEAEHAMRLGLLR